MAVSFTHWGDPTIAQRVWTTRDGATYGYTMLKCAVDRQVIHAVHYRETDGIRGLTRGDNVLHVVTLDVRDRIGVPTPVLDPKPTLPNTGNVGLNRR